MSIDKKEKLTEHVEYLAGRLVYSCHDHFIIFGSIFLQLRHQCARGASIQTGGRLLQRTRQHNAESCLSTDPPTDGDHFHGVNQLSVSSFKNQWD